jgi:pyruvate carboxylase subunit B
MKKASQVHVHGIRDGFQSVYGARVFTKDFMPASPLRGKLASTHFEAGGWRRFQALYFYSNEDAFAMMDEFRKVADRMQTCRPLSAASTSSVWISSPETSSSCMPRCSRNTAGAPSETSTALNDVNNLIDSGRAIHDAGLRLE